MKLPYLDAEWFNQRRDLRNIKFMALGLCNLKETDQ